MELKLTKNPLKIELNLSQFRAKTEVECVELYSDSVGNQWGIYLELVWNWLANPMFSFWTVWGMHRGCWGRSGESIRDYYDCFGKQFIFVVAAGECIGNLSGILTNYWETVGIHRDPWRICGDFWLRIHSLGEVQIQTEHIHTHAISLTKPRFPFHVLTGFEPPDPPKWSSRLHEVLILRKSPFPLQGRFLMKFGGKLSPKGVPKSL